LIFDEVVQGVESRGLRANCQLPQNLYVGSIRAALLIA
jgi:hypothetical protein